MEVYCSCFFQILAPENQNLPCPIDRLYDMIYASRTMGPAMTGAGGSRTVFREPGRPTQMVPGQFFRRPGRLMPVVPGQNSMVELEELIWFALGSSVRWIRKSTV